MSRTSDHEPHIHLPSQTCQYAPDICRLSQHRSAFAFQPWTEMKTAVRNSEIYNTPTPSASLDPIR